MKKQIQEKKIIIGDLVINYFEKSGNENAVIFLHGWRLDGGIWLKIIKSLNQLKHSFYSLDLPGFGKSTIPPFSFTVGDYSDVIKEFIEKLKLKNVCLVGHSFGGQVTIKVAVSYPPLVKKLVLINCAGVKRKTFWKKIKKIIAKILKPIFVLFPLKSLRRKLYQAIGAEDYLATPHLRDIFLNIIKDDIIQELPLISQNTLVVWGEKDKITPLPLGRLIKQKIRFSNFVILKNQGHSDFFEKSEEFLESFSNFLNKDQCPAGEFQNPP